MEGTGRALLYMLVLAIAIGIGVVLLDKEYRPAKIAQTNRGVFVNIPVDAPPEAPDRGDKE